VAYHRPKTISSIIGGQPHSPYDFSAVFPKSRYVPCKCGEEQSTEDLVKDAESLLKEVYEERGGSSWWLRKDMILVLQCVFRRLRVLSGQMTC